MPGVPSGRGCDGCRRQKKKCDQARPRCSRCERLDLNCVGAGVQRFKFKSHNALQVISADRRTRSPSSSQSVDSAEDINPIPSSSLDRLLREMVYMMRPSTNLRYNFVYAYGGFLMIVPKHLGINEALDASAEAVVSAYSHFCRGGKSVSSQTLILYTRALSALRLCLEDPAKACATETLCAVMILMICQNFIGSQGSRCTIHCEGAAQILKARGNTPPRCQLEAALLLSLRGPVVFDALFNENIRLSRLEWEMLVQNELDDGSYEGHLMHCLSYAPDFIRRGRDVLSHGVFDATLQTEIDIQYRRIKRVVAGMYDRLMSVRAPSVNEDLDLTQKKFLHGVYQRGYALGLFVAIILNCTMLALSFDKDELNHESMMYATEIVNIADQAAMYRPLGAGYVLLCLLAAFAGSTDQAQRLQIVSMIEDYYGDFQWSMDCKTFEELRTVNQRLLICEPNDPGSFIHTMEKLFYGQA